MSDVGLPSGIELRSWVSHGHNQRADLLGPGTPQGSRRLDEGGPGCKDIVNQNDAFAGDCRWIADGKCAGGHFNPNGGKHSGPEDPGRHAGDFGNIKADNSGKATYKMLDSMISLSGPNSIIGRSVIVHAKADDMKTQPSGDSGDRIGCGVIGIADPKMQMTH